MSVSLEEGTVCPECDVAADSARAPSGMTLEEWHQYAGECTVMLSPCTCVVDAEEVGLSP